MKNFWYLFSGYMVIWVLIFSYLLKINRKIADLTQKIERIELEK